MKQLDMKLEKKPSAQHVQELAECRIRNLQAFAELQFYNDHGKFLNKHPLLFGRSEFSTLKKLFETDPSEFLRQHKNVLDNIKRYKCYMKRATRKDKKASDKQHLEQHQERERLFRLVIEQKK